MGSTVRDISDPQVRNRGSIGWDIAHGDPAEDLRGDIEYKTHIAGELTRWAIRVALHRARG